MAQKSYLDIARECDDFPYSDDPSGSVQTGESYYSFKLGGIDARLGYVLPEIASKLPLTHDWLRNDTKREIIFQPRDTPSDSEAAVQHRDQVLAAYLRQLQQAKIFNVLDGWRDEVYPIYGPQKKLLFSMERSASALFGIVTYGVHMTGFVKEGNSMKLWTPRRALTKQTYPGMMDNTVAGGLSTGETPWDCLVRESLEEASLPEDVVKSAKACGTMVYFHLRDASAGGEVGLCQPECQYVYDLEMPADVIPKPGDDEAIDFQLLTIKEVQDAMAAGRFKPNCALLLLDFFVRHGILTAENEPHYIEIVSRLHRRLPFPMA